MAFFTELTADFQRFLAAQQVFFVATAPRRGRVNLSPKGMDTLRVLDAKTVAYLDLTGSGNETAAHVEEDGRLTLMACSFAADPLILRLYGRGEVVHRRDPRWAGLRARFGPEIPGERQILVLHVESVQTSCGWGVPRCAQVSERDTLRRAAAAKGAEWIEAHWRRSNQASIDGLPTRLLEDQ